MDKIPESLIPITKHKYGQYFSGKTPIPKHWTVYHVVRNTIYNDGHLDHSNFGCSDIKCKNAILMKRPYEWYVAKDNGQFDIPRTVSQEKKEESAVIKINNFMKLHTRSSPKNSRGGKKSRTRRRNRRGTRRK